MQQEDQDNTEKEFNKSLTRKIFNLEDLRIYLLFRFGSFKAAATKVGWTSSRVRQLVIGYYLPETPQLINRLAESWDIDPVILTQIFEKFRDKKNEKHNL